MDQVLNFVPPIVSLSLTPLVKIIVNTGIGLK